jgi:hypothetical protein
VASQRQATQRALNFHRLKNLQVWPDWLPLLLSKCFRPCRLGWVGPGGAKLLLRALPTHRTLPERPSGVASQRQATQRALNLRRLKNLQVWPDWLPLLLSKCFRPAGWAGSVRGARNFYSGLYPPPCGPGRSAGQIGPGLQAFPGLSFQNLAAPLPAPNGPESQNTFGHLEPSRGCPPETLMSFEWKVKDKPPRGL